MDYFIEEPTIEPGDKRIYCLLIDTWRMLMIKEPIKLTKIGVQGIIWDIYK
jgi:hypothetical protein